MLQAKQVLQGRYQLKQQLGHNDDRHIWLAVDLTMQPPQPVVVKLLSFDASMKWDNFDLFEREIAVLKALNHAKIPRYRDSFSLDRFEGFTWFALVEDHIPGQSLSQLLEQGKHFTPTQIRQIAIQVLLILVDLHEREPAIVHRDIKPSNLIWGDDRQIYLIDFGAVQNHSGAEGADLTIVGTSGYAPPEQFYGHAVSASDLYAVGATLIHLLTGVCPADLPQKDLQIQFHDRVSISPSFAQWIDTLTAPDVSDRFQTARQALKALKTSAMSVEKLALPRPADSQIQLHKSDGQLKIRLPGIGMSGNMLSLFLMQFNALGLVLFGIVYWLTPAFQKAHKINPEEAIGFATFLSVLIAIPWLMTFCTVISQLWEAWQPTQLIFDKVPRKVKFHPVLLLPAALLIVFLTALIMLFLAFFLLPLFGLLIVFAVMKKSQQPPQPYEPFQWPDFRLEWRFLGVCWRKKQGVRERIQDVTASVQALEHKSWFRKRPREVPIVLIQVGQQRLSFAARFSEAECVWLAQEIKDWLNLKR
ncbi:serine/threonine protein kinase [Phormidesmis priestleyi]